MKMPQEPTQQILSQDVLRSRVACVQRVWGRALPESLLYRLEVEPSAQNDKKQAGHLCLGEMDRLREFLFPTSNAEYSAERAFIRSTTVRPRAYYLELRWTTHINRFVEFRHQRWVLVGASPIVQKPDDKRVIELEVIQRPIF